MMQRQRRRKEPSIEAKANRTLNFILIVMLLIFVRSWHLSIMQHERGVQEARRPQKRTAILHPERGTIRDRFGLPLALNKVQYNAAIVYGQIRQIPKSAKRREHIRDLAQMLSETLGRDSEEIEDLIHSRAALLPNSSFVIAKDLDEETYFRLKMAEREWLGLQAERMPRRVYPQGRVACDVVGHLGAINAKEYRAVVEEKSLLENYLADRDAGHPGPPPEGFATPMEARRRLLELKERAYTITDRVGRAGIESAYDADLRGYRGLRSYQVDIYGNFLRELPEARDPLPGQQVVLTLSSELQEFAEQLLTENERLRDGSSRGLPEPFIKGGAIVALDPGSGEVLALASYPRYDPSDFVGGDPRRWLELESYIGDIWDGKVPLMRESYSLIKGGFFDEVVPLTCEKYLELTGASPELRPLLVSDPSDTTPLSELWLLRQAGVQVIDLVEEMARTLFHDLHFRHWRATEGKEFLRKKRSQEERYARPYLDYFETEERRQFREFFERNRWEFARAFLTGDFSSCSEALFPYFEHFSTWAAELAAGAHSQAPWHSAYMRLRGASPELLPKLRRYRDLNSDEKKIATAFYPRYGFGYARSHAFRQAEPQGSVFKIVTAYEALMQRYAKNPSNLNPLTMIDRVQRGSVGMELSGKLIPDRYKGGRLLRTQRRNVGQIDITKALETSSNSYFGILCADHIDEPEDLNRAAFSLGFGQRTGLGLPGEYAGRLPMDLPYNRTGLYSYSCGQHTLVVTPLQTAIMLAALGNGGTVFKPRIVSLLAGREPEREAAALFSQPDDRLSFLGIDAPLFTGAATPSRPEITEVPFGVQRAVSLPPAVRNYLCEGMRLGTSGEHGHARPSAVRGYGAYPWILHDYRDLHTQIIGKTGTAERVERINRHSAHTYNHIWFGGLCFPKPQLIPFRFETPELVIVVYLRFGSYGHEAAPLAGQILKKWRELQKKYS